MTHEMPLKCPFKKMGLKNKGHKEKQIALYMGTRVLSPHMCFNTPITLSDC
jgi:hypothetical protein